MDDHGEALDAPNDTERAHERHIRRGETRDSPRHDAGLTMTLYDAGGIHVDTARRDTDLLHSAYVGELSAFVDAVRAGGRSPVPGAAASTALALASAAARSVETGAVVDVAGV